MDDQKTISKRLIALAIERVGRLRLASELGVTPGTVSHWKTGRLVVANGHIRKIESLAGISIYEWKRPWIFGEPPEGYRDAA